MKQNRIFIYHIVVAGAYIFVSVIFLFFKGDTLSYFSFRTIDLISFFIILIIGYLTLLIARHLLRFGELALQKKSLTQSLLLILYAFVLFALPEEIIFRGIIQHYFQSIIPVYTAIIISSLIYAMAHILNGASGLKLKEWNWKLVGVTFIAGIYLGIAYVVTGSLLIPIILHGLLIVAHQVFMKNSNK